MGKTIGRTSGTAIGRPFIGAEAVASGRLTRHLLRTRYVAIYPGVYLAPDIEVTAVVRAQAAWLWSGRRGVLAGRSAAAVHGAKWVDGRLPAEIVHHNRRPPPGIRTRADRLADDEIALIQEIPVTTPARTAFDIASRERRGRAVAAIDALARATGLKTADIDLLAQRYPGRRGSRRARVAIDLVDPGAESPRETWLRLLLIDAGFPRPTTQIPVYDEYGQLAAVVDMGWEEIKVAAEYEGEWHLEPRRFGTDIHRQETLARLGWIDVRVTKTDTAGGVIGRVSAAWRRRA